MHVLVIALFGDTSGVSRDGRTSGWGISFVASLRPMPAHSAPQRASRATMATSVANQPVQNAAAQQPAVFSGQTSITTPTQATETIGETSVQPAIELIPLIAVDVEKPVGTFVIPSLQITPLQAPVSLVTPAFANIANDMNSVKVPTHENGFGIYVAPINERASVEVSHTQFSAPTLHSLSVPQSSTELHAYVPPPVSKPDSASPPLTPMVVETLGVSKVAVPPTTRDPVEPVSPIALPPAIATPNMSIPAPIDVSPMAPLERIAAPPVASRELRAYMPPKVAPINEMPIVLSPPSIPASSVLQPPVMDKTAGEAKLPTSADNQRRINEEIFGKRGDSVKSAPQSIGIEQRQTSQLPIASAPPASLPKLDLDRLRQRAREVASEGDGQRTLLPFPTIAKEVPKHNIEKIFDKALKRPDCKDEYANFGLAALVPLLRDAVKGDGCKW